MKAYKGSFKKRNGEIRNMLFAHLEDLPDTFLEQKIVGSGVERSYPEGMQLVWDIEEDNFRVFNWSTTVGEVQRLNISSNRFN